MKLSLSRVVLYLAGGSLLLVGAVAQQKTSAPKQTATASDKKPSSKKTMSKDATADLTKCSGPPVQASNSITFVAVDQPYDVVITNNTVFTDCDPILHLTSKGDTHTCTANVAGLKPGQHRYSKYLAIPPTGSKDCPQSHKTGKGLGGSDPSDITVP